MRRPLRPPCPPRRPPRAASGRRHAVELRLAPADWQTLWRRAALARLPLGDYLAAAALRSAAPPAAPVAALRLYGRLGRAAVELDQVLRRAREDQGAAALLPQLDALAAELRTLRRQLAGLEPHGAPDGAP
jgi:hypothetical protein